MFEAALTEVEQLYIIEVLRWLHTSGIRVARNMVGILVQDYCRQMKAQMGARNFRSSDGCRPSKDWITNFMRRWACELAFMDAYKGSSSDSSTIVRARHLIHRNHLFDPDDWEADADASASSTASAALPSSASTTYTSAPSSSSSSTAPNAPAGVSVQQPRDETGALATLDSVASSSSASTLCSNQLSNGRGPAGASTANADVAAASSSKKPRVESISVPVPKARREKLLVTLAPNLPPVQQLYRANMRPKYGPSPQWAAKNSKLSLEEQRYIIQVFNYLSENGVPTTKKIISLVIAGSTYRPSRNWVDMFLRTWERELHFEPWTVLSRATQQRALALLRQSGAFEFDECGRPEPPPGVFFRARVGELVNANAAAAERESMTGVGACSDAGAEGEQDDGEFMEDEDEELVDLCGDVEDDELIDGDGGGPVTIEARFEDDDGAAGAATAEPSPVFTITHSTFTAPNSLSKTPYRSLPSPIILKCSPVIASSLKK